MQMPLAAPNAAPHSRPATMPAVRPQPASIAIVAATVVAASTAPTERSMPPDRMTKVWPTAINAITAAWIVISNRLSSVKKYGDRRDRIEPHREQDARHEQRRVVEHHLEHPAPAGGRRWPVPAGRCARGQVATGHVVSATSGRRRRRPGAIRPGRRPTADRELHDPLLARLGPRQLAGDPALAHHQDPVAHPQHLGQIGRDQQDGAALRRVNSTISRWTSSLAPTSMPWVGSSRIRIRERAISHLARTTFCWLPPLR